MKTLEEYERQSGHMIHKEKNYFYFCHSTASSIVQEIEDRTEFTRGKFCFIYLGFPIEHARKRKFHFSKLIKKVQNKLQAWKGKLLSLTMCFIVFLSICCLPFLILSV